MVLALIPAAVLAVVAAVAFARLRAVSGERDRIAADSAALRTSFAALEREAAEVRASEAAYRALVDEAGDWMWAADEVGVLTFSNPAGSALLGYDSLVGVAAAELTHPDDRAALAAPEGWSGVVRRRRADGSYRTVDTRAVPVLDAGGRVTGWRGIDRDLSGEPLPPPARPAPVSEAAVAVVRRPVVDGRREVVGYEVVADGSLLDAFDGPTLERLAGSHPLWVAAGAPVAPGSAVVQVGADADAGAVEALARRGHKLALDGYEGGASGLLDHCAIVKVRAAGRSDDELRELIAEPAERGALLVATEVDNADEFTRCRLLGFSHFQGEFFAKPRFDRHGVIGGLASLQTLAELTAADASFEDLERTIGADVGLSLALLRYVNSAFFSLPREVDSVREALTLLGTRAVRRWATVMALSAIPDAPEELVALALLRARMCEMMGGTTTDEERERLFTVGLFSVADALLDARMEDVLAELPFSEEISAALLCHEGPKGRLLAAVLDYERGHFPEDLGADGVPIADAYLGALQWADEVGRSLG
jgi:c-di-GMP phosphodiesterase